MSRRDNYHDNAVDESFSANLKMKRSGDLNTKAALTHGMLCLTICEMFYNPTRAHTNNDRVSPAVYE